MSHRWIKLFDNEEAMLNSIPLGKTQLVVVENKKICLARTTDGVSAVSDKCPHNGASLSMGYCNEKNEIICPMHRYPFNLKSGRTTSGIAMHVDTFPLKIESKGVFIGLKVKWWQM